MPENTIVELKLTPREAHVVLRALASHNASDANAGDRQPCTWIAERLLRILSPELGPQPLTAILAGAHGDAPPEAEAGRGGLIGRLPPGGDARRGQGGQTP